jgi:hypothetical protein
VTVYAEVGQHSGADWGYVTAKTRPAKAREYRGLAQELRLIGYDDLKPVQRRSSSMLDEFNREIHRLCSRR